MKIPKNARKWILALKSGKYKQTKTNLCRVERTTKKYCCLGVGVELAIQDGMAIKIDYIDPFQYMPPREFNPSSIKRYRIVEFDGEKDYLEKRLAKVRTWLGLKNKDVSTRLASFNDAGWTFKRIAKELESNPEVYFSDK